MEIYWPGFMKVIFTFILLSLLLTGCGRSDVQIQHEITGTWLVHFGGKVQCVNVISPDGSYTATITGFVNGNVIRIQGTIRAQDGELVETITRDTDPNQMLPMIVSGQIITLDGRQMITKWGGNPSTTTVAQRIRP
jgi:hypothetical protein